MCAQQICPYAASGADQQLGGTYFDFTGDTIVDLAKEAASLGIDMVVMDDGWFGKRNDDNSSLGTGRSTKRNWGAVWQILLPVCMSRA